MPIMENTSPRVRAQLATLPAGTGERFAGCALMGLPFSSGHYLAYRRFGASSIGPAYSAVWVMRPDSGWTIYADAPPAQSCARYFGATPARTSLSPVSAHWRGPHSVTVEVPGMVEWDLELGATLTTAAISRLARRMPASWWANAAVLAAMGRLVGPLLHTGRMSLAGLVPDGQYFQARPLHIWAVISSRAVVDGTSAGTPLPLPKQVRLADVWMPQRGIFATDLHVRYPFAGAPAKDLGLPAGTHEPAAANHDSRGHGHH